MQLRDDYPEHTHRDLVARETLSDFLSRVKPLLEVWPASANRI